MLIRSRRAERVRLCFGSKRLWRKQHHLEQNGYASHDEWIRDWRQARNDEFFVLGSRDEMAGCQLCVATVADDGTLTLRLRMPDCLAAQHGKYLVIQGVRFAYGQEQVLAALDSNVECVRCRREHGEKSARATTLGQAVSYRFKRDDKGWRVFATTQMMDVPVVTHQRRGTIGVDLNADHLAVAETDASGNYVHRRFSVPLVPYGKSRPRLRPSSATPWPAWWLTPAMRASPSSLSGWTSGRRKLSWKASPAGTAGCWRLSATARSKRASCLGATAREWKYTRLNPAFSSVIGRAEVHGTLRAQRPLGCGSGTGRTFTRLFRCIPRLTGCPRRQWRPRRLHRTCKEASEARVDVLGCGLGSAETGACSATPAGEAETPTQSGSGCLAGLAPCGGLNEDPFGVPW